MITGVVTPTLEATIPLLVHNASGQNQHVDAILDTGFNGLLTLPPALINAMGFPWIRRNPGMLADGSMHWFDVYEAMVVWNGQTRIVRVQEANTTPLIGMSFLVGFELQIKVVQGGIVTVDAIP